jgi:uncharacterized membrane protein (DUF2068 family)
LVSLPGKGLHRRSIPADPSKDGFLRLVAVFKFCKATFLLVTAWGLLKMVNPAFGAQVDTWIEGLRSGFGQDLLRHGLEAMNRLGPVHLHLLSVVSVIYAGLFLTEGYGLWLGRRWAEYLTVVVTSLLIPYELYEVVTKGRAVAIAVLILNVLIVAYLLRRVRVEWRAGHGG